MRKITLIEYSEKNYTRIGLFLMRKTINSEIFWVLTLGTVLCYDAEPHKQNDLDFWFNLSLLKLFYLLFYKLFKLLFI